MTKIGLEIHCQLTNLESKLFCSCKANYRGFEPNTNICPVCIGLPGSLPRLNKKAVEKATIIAMALNCNTPDKLAFFRKNYFYPDLPKNFQITQLNVYGEHSIGQNGKISVDDKEIKIRRIQLEEDPGRLIYEGTSEKTQITLVDYNRAGTPLVEIVTEPDFENERQVRLFLNILSDLLENLNVSNPSLEGAMRADGNISIEGGNKVEIKNVTSFHDLEKALHFEITRQESLVSRNIPIDQETRHWDDRRKITISARSKEGEEDYRYFLEGDIPWIKIDEQIKVKLQKEMPESISSKSNRLIDVHGVNRQEAEIISTNKTISDSFDKIYAICVPPELDNLVTLNITEHEKVQAPDFPTKFGKEIAHLLINYIMAIENYQEKLAKDDFIKNLADLSTLLVFEKLPRNLLNNVLHEVNKTNKTLVEIYQKLDLQKISDIGQLINVIDEVFSEEPEAVADAKENPETINYLVGKIMEKTKGKADPKQTLEFIQEKLKK